MDWRTETDLLGEHRLSTDCLWGVHTARAQMNFQVTDLRTSHDLVCAMAMVKKAACQANHELGYLPDETAGPITQACDDVIDGKLSDAFILDALQGGAGTSTNMNVNEVVANRALAIRGLPPGSYDAIHQLEHVNLHQSTNDVFPTAVKIAAISLVRELSTRIAGLQDSCQRREKAFAEIVKMGRTELQPAVPITLGVEFGAFAEAFSRDRWRAFKCEERLRLVNLGGTAVGTGLTAPRSYIFLVIEKLRDVTGLGLSRGENTVDQTANADAFVEVSGTVNAFATNLLKICGDLRLLHAAGEIRLPAVQAGSSIMPGKVNPVILECAMQTAIKAKANNGIVSECASRGSLQINEFLPLLAHALLESLSMLGKVGTMLAEHVDGIEADPARCMARLVACPTLATALLPELGYDRVSELLKAFAVTDQPDLREFLVEELGAETVDRHLNPQALTSLGYRD